MDDLVRRYTDEIKALIGQNTRNVLAVGEKLLAVKKALKRGDWLDWLYREFGWSQRTAYNMIAAAGRFNLAKFASLPIEPSALYLLSEKKTPDAVVNQALTLARQGETVTHARAKEMVEQYRAWDGERTEAPEPTAQEVPAKSAPAAIAMTGEPASAIDFLDRLEACGLPEDVHEEPLPDWLRSAVTGEGLPVRELGLIDLVIEDDWDVRPLEPDDRAWIYCHLRAHPERWEEYLASQAIDAEPDQAAVETAPEPVAALVGPVATEAWPKELPTVVEAPALILTSEAVPEPGKRPVFNLTNEMVDWAKWTWNPVTGCEHTCVYCYARDLAEGRGTSGGPLYAEGFAPTFRPERLKAPYFTRLPEEGRTLPELAQYEHGWRNVFVCSMADLFGRWVPQAWIDAVLDEVRVTPQWNYLFLTKFPQRLAEIDWPDNAWVGTTVDEQYRVQIAERAFRNVKATVKWLSCEPLRQRLSFDSLEMFNWVVIGGQSKSSQAPAFQPPWEWVEHLHQQARAAKLKIYWKDNLKTRPREYPGMADDA